MDKKSYTYDELCRMSYQELRRISILFRLPANIKKKHMISMIEAHQNGDGQTKIEIANKVIEERNLRRMNTQMKRTKPFILSSRVRTHQVSTDLSVATKNEFETRYSYVAHYTKGNKGSEISGIIREEAEVSRRNRSVVQKSSKSSRKLPTVGRTEIMLPRNHSLTTMVQLMPQHEMNFIPSSKGTRVLTSETNWNANVSYDSVSTPPSGSEYHCQATVGGQFVHGSFPFPSDYGNSFISPTTHEVYRNLRYWHARELYSSVVPGNLLIPVVPNLMNPDGSAQYTVAPNSMNLPGGATFQRQYESFIRCSTGERDMEATNGALGAYNPPEMSYGGNPTKSEELPECEYRRYDGRHVGESQHNEDLTYLVDIFAPRNDRSRGIYQGSTRQDCNVAYPVIRARNVEEMCRNGKEGYQTCNDPGEKQDGYIVGEEAIVFRNRQDETEQENCESDGRYRLPCQQQQVVLPSFMSTFHEMHSPESFVSEPCIDSPNLPNEGEHGNSINVTMPSFPRCRYLSGHNQFPESISTPHSTSDSTVFSYSARDRDRAYSQCRDSSTATTAVHFQPIMASVNVARCEIREAERTWNVSDVGNEQSAQEMIPNNNVENMHHYQRSLFYSYPEEHSPYGMVDANAYTNWNEFCEDLETKMAQNNGHDVRVVQCKRHGYHYLYTLSTSQ